LPRHPILAQGQVELFGDNPVRLPRHRPHIVGAVSVNASSASESKDQARDDLQALHPKGYLTFLARYLPGHLPRIQEPQYTPIKHVVKRILEKSNRTVKETIAGNLRAYLA